MNKIVLKLTDIQKTFYPGTNNENKVLKGIDFEVYAGDFITVIGGNGAGKSTLLNTIAGTILPTTGTIELADKDVTKMNAFKRSKFIGRVFQDPRMGTATRLTIEENMAIADRRGQKQNLSTGVKRKQIPFFEKQLAQLGLGLEDRLKMEIGLLSGGQRQAITLLMATLNTPDLLLLDEHTAALDPKTSKIVLELTKKLVEQQNLTTLMITHNMEDALAYGNRLIMLHQGRIVVDVRKEEKENLTVEALLRLFHQKSGDVLNDDALLMK